MTKQVNLTFSTRLSSLRLLRTSHKTVSEVSKTALTLLQSFTLDTDVSQIKVSKVRPLVTTAPNLRKLLFTGSLPKVMKEPQSATTLKSITPS